MNYLVVCSFDYQEIEEEFYIGTKMFECFNLKEKI